MRLAGAAAAATGRARARGPGATEGGSIDAALVARGGGSRPA